MPDPDLPAAAPPPPPDPLIGQVVGGAYQITGLLGSGGMGNVYEAVHVRLPRRFAIKVVRQEMADGAAFERFKREAEITSSLGNRHIVEVLDFNVLPSGSPYLVMEHLAGEDLATRLARVGRLDASGILHVFGQVISALESAHAQGIVHRDIKPENIFLAQIDGEPDFVKLLDFGLSKIRGMHKRITADLSVLGTPWYMSPEQARGDADLDPRTDLYSLGVVIYQALTGQVPFEGENIYGVLTQIATQAPRPLRSWVPELPEALERVLARALAKDPAQRPSSVTVLWTELQQALGAASAPDDGFSAAHTQLATLPHEAPAPPLPPEEPSGGERPITEPDQTPLSEVPADRPPRSPARLMALSFGVTLLLGGAAYGIFAIARPTAPPVQTIEVVQARSAAVAVHLLVTPPEATVSVDGVEVRDNPLSLARSDKKVRLAFSAKGFTPEVREIIPTEDQNLAVALAPALALTPLLPAPKAARAEPEPVVRHAKPAAAPGKPRTRQTVHPSKKKPAGDLFDKL